MRPQDEHLVELLRTTLWQKVFGERRSKAEKWMGQVVSNAIEQALGLAMEKRGIRSAPHPDTIVNFLNHRTTPSVKILDLLSWFLLGDAEHFATFEDFKRLHGEAPTATIPTPPSDQLPTEDRSRRQRRRWLGVPAIICLLLLGFCICRPTDDTSFRQVFEDSGLEKLQARDWFLLPDSVNLSLWDRSPHRGSNYLTLETHLGDSWLENTDYEPEVINVLARKIRCGACCTLRVKLVDFNPYQRYQQAGFFLFYQTHLPYPSVRYTLACGGESNFLQIVQREGKYINRDLTRLASPYYARSHLSDIENGRVVTPLDSIIMECTIERDQYYFSYRRYGNGRSDTIPVVNLRVDHGSPRMIGLAAFQGRPEIPYPSWPVADVIPAHFAYFQLEPCEGAK